MLEMAGLVVSVLVLSVAVIPCVVVSGCKVESPSRPVLIL